MVKREQYTHSYSYICALHSCIQCPEGSYFHYFLWHRKNINYIFFISFFFSLSLYMYSCQRRAAVFVNRRIIAKIFFGSAGYDYLAGYLKKSLRNREIF